MIRQFRMIAGPNGSGKSTLVKRAYFFDNSGPQMIFLGQYSHEAGFEFSVAADRLPRWFRSLGLQG